MLTLVRILHFPHTALENCSHPKVFLEVYFPSIYSLISCPPESQNCFGWKKPLRSPGPIFKSALPDHH